MTILLDIRFALRTYIQSSTATAVAIVVLATGISANTALFTILNSVVLRPLNFSQPDRLMMLWDTQPGVPSAPTATGHFIEWQSHSTGFASMAGLANTRVSLTGRDQPEQLPGASVTANFFDVLGIAPRLGRTFLQSEQSPGRNRVVIITTGLWRRRFAAAPGIIGQTIDLDRIPHTVIGVLPDSFQWPRRETDLWTPLAIGPALAADHVVHCLQVVGRLKAGLTPRQAQSEMNILAADIARRIPAATGHGVKIEPLLERAIGDTRPILLVLFAATGFVLLLSCANIANLLLAKANSRRKEIAVRAALGASRARIVRQLMTESLLLAGMGGALGFVLSFVWLRVLTLLAPPGTPRLDEISIDLRVLAFTICATVSAALLFGLVPALQACRTGIHPNLKPRGRTRSILILAETALSLVLCIGAGLSARSLLALERASAGFTPDRVLTMRLQLPPSVYTDPTTQIAFFTRLLPAVETLPGVQSAGLINDLPLSGGAIHGGFALEGRPAWSRAQQPLAGFRVATAGYLASLRIPVVRGRFFTSDDSAARPPVIVVSETMARRYWRNEDPIGKRMRLKWTTAEPWRTVIGVAGDVKSDSLYTPSSPEIYIPYQQHPAAGMTITVRYKGDATVLIRAIRAQVGALDRNLPVSAIKPLDRIVADSIAPRTFSTVLLTGFALIALFLAAVGIYGVVSATVSQRSKEIGVRMALGATRLSVIRRVTGEQVRWILAGLALGLMVSAGLARLAAGLLYGVKPLDAISFTTAPLLLLAVAVLACLIPACRAARVDPMFTLRQQ